MSRYWPLIKLIPIKTNFEFVRFAKFAAVLSVIAVAGSIFMTLYPLKPPCGGLNCGVDFKGGNLLEISMGTSPVDLAKVRASLTGLGLGDVQVQGFGGGGANAKEGAQVRFETPAGGNAAQTVTQVQQVLTKTLGPQVQFTRTEVVGAKVSGELLFGGAMALGIAVLLMMIYIWFRFEWQFALGAVAGLMHDTILVFGLFAVTKMEFSLTAVAAILTVIGYSMNDTVVVFDRLRENLRKYKTMPLKDVINLSINETLSRTIITGVTAIFALGVLALLGGESLFPFSVSLIFGIVFGTYSSIYVGAPIILLWGVKRGEEAAKPLKPAAAR
jgi:preprotein translocase subunit SecF